MVSIEQDVSPSSRYLDDGGIRYQQLKSRLQGRSRWLQAFTKSAVAQAIELIKNKPRNYYEPLLLESTLKEASTALDRCLAFRREAYELEIAAVKAEADYQLFLELAELDQQLEINALALAASEAERSGYHDASPMYADLGFRRHDQTLSDSACASLKDATERQRLLTMRWTVRKAYEADYHSRHSAPANAHNFEERMKRTVTLLADDLQEAREKLLAVRLGLKAIYGEDFAEPVMEGEQSLDELVVWLREVIRFLDLESQQEANYELVIPLGQKWRASEEPIVAAETLWQAVDQQGPEKVIHFKLEDVFFNQEHVRLRAVGLAFGPQPELTDLTMLDRFGFWRLRATIHTPKQRGVQTSTDYYRPPIVLGNVSAYGRSIPVAMRSGPECHNVDPRGEWTIVLNRYSVWCDSQAKSIEKMAQETRTIADLKLFLSVVAKPSKAAISVFTPCSV